MAEIPAGRQNSIVTAVKSIIQLHLPKSSELIAYLEAPGRLSSVY